MSSKHSLDLFGNSLEIGDKVFILRGLCPANERPDPSKVILVHLAVVDKFNENREATVSCVAPVQRVNKHPHNVVKVSSSMSKAELMLHAKILFPNATEIKI